MKYRYPLNRARPERDERRRKSQRLFFRARALALLLLVGVLALGALGCPGLGMKVKLDCPPDENGVPRCTPSVQVEYVK